LFSDDDGYGCAEEEEEEEEEHRDALAEKGMGGE